MTRKTVGIIGYGFVGKAASQLSEVYDTTIYDPYNDHFDDIGSQVAAYTSDFVFICVPTPTLRGGTSLDTSIVDECANRWAWYNVKGRRKDGNAKSILVIKSTINVGTTKYLRDKHNSDNIVHNPEFLTQRTAMQDFREPVEVVVGGDPSATSELVNLYKGYYPFGDDEPEYREVNSCEAELLKMGRNSFYALKVTYFNELNGLCQKFDMDYGRFVDLFTLGGKHPWVAKQHTQVPGPDGMMGFGGACLPKDSEGLVELARRVGAEMPTLEAAVNSNKRRRK